MCKRVPFNLHYFFFSRDIEAVCEAAVDWINLFSSADLNQNCLVAPWREQMEANQEEVCSIARALLYFWKSEWMSWDAEEMLRKKHILIPCIPCACGWSVLSEPGANTIQRMQARSLLSSPAVLFKYVCLEAQIGRSKK